MNTELDKSIKNLIKIEKRYSKYFFKSDYDFREALIAKVFNSVVKKNEVFKKPVNKLIMHFPNSSKISREFLLSHEKSPDHFWEPQTHKLLNILCKNKKDIIFGGAFFGDHACFIAKNFSKSTIHCFEPVSKSRKYLKKNKIENGLKNLKILSNALYKKEKQKLYLVDKINDDAGISLSFNKEDSSKFFLTDTLDNYTHRNKIKKIDLLMIDVEGSELNVLLGAKNLLKENNIDNIIFEMHSNYLNWKNGLKNTSIVKLLLKNNFYIYAIRDYYSNKKLRKKIELLELENTYLEGPNHGFNLIATRNKGLVRNKEILLSKKNYSPKYLFHKSSKKFHYI